MDADEGSTDEKAQAFETLKRALLDELRTRVRAPFYATLDGALFDDLPALLRGSGLSHRSLYLGGDTSEAMTFGPWFVVCNEFADAERLVELVGDAALPVFWELKPVGETEALDAQAALYRHLRGLNKIVVPKEPGAAAASPDAPAGESVGPHERLVIFRHYEPNALALIVSVLDEAQISRLLGPAKAIYAATIDMDGIQFVERDNADAPTPSGFLRLTQEQLDGVAEERRNISTERIAAYLRQVAPMECRAYDDRQLLEFVKRSAASAGAFGVRTEYAQGLWAYMRLTSKGDFSQDPTIQRFMKLDHFATPDQRAEMLFDARLNAMKGAL